MKSQKIDKKANTFRPKRLQMKNQKIDRKTNTFRPKRLQMKNGLDI